MYKNIYSRSWILCGKQHPYFILFSHRCIANVKYMVELRAASCATYLPRPECSWTNQRWIHYNINETLTFLPARNNWNYAKKAKVLVLPTNFLHEEQIVFARGHGSSFNIKFGNWNQQYFLHYWTARFNNRQMQPSFLGPGHITMPF